MVKLRLRRKGRAHLPIYDIVALDSRKRRDGAYIERLGYFNPHSHPSTIVVDPDRALYWLNVGAQPSLVVKNLLSYEGILLRKHLAGKGKNQVEIEEEVAKHKQTAIDRYNRLKVTRVERKLAKVKAEEKAAADAEEAKVKAAAQAAREAEEAKAAKEAEEAKAKAAAELAAKADEEPKAAE